MKMFKTYDEALKTLNDIRTYLAISRADDCVEELDKVARYFINEKHKENPTLSECIKEWEERGWKGEISTSAIQINYIKFGRLSGIHIYKWLKEVRILYENLHYEEFHLLSKTIKALEVEE